MSFSNLRHVYRRFSPGVVASLNSVRGRLQDLAVVEKHKAYIDMQYNLGAASYAGKILANRAYRAKKTVENRTAVTIKAIYEADDEIWQWAVEEISEATRLGQSRDLSPVKDVLQCIGLIRSMFEFEEISDEPMNRVSAAQKAIDGLLDTQKK